MKIILVDENEETCKILKEVAQLSQSDVLCFSSFAEAASYLAQNPDVDAVIFERQIKGVVVDEFLTKTTDIDIPKILLTSATIKAEEAKALEDKGVDKIVPKPFNPLEVLTDVVELLKEKKGEEYIKERLHTVNADRSALKKALQKLIEFFKKLFSR